MKQFAKLTLCALVALLSLSVSAQEEEVKKKKKAVPAVEELILVGTISKNEAPAAEEGKKAKRVAPFSLTLEDGTVIPLALGTVKKAKIDLETYVGKKVKVTAEGIKKAAKKKTTYRIKAVTAIEEVAADAPEGDEAAE